MQDPDDPDAMTPEARARELAEILATGYLRHRTLSARNAGSTCIERLDDGDRQRENEVDGLAEQSVHVPHADGSAPPAEQEART